MSKAKTKKRKMSKGKKTVFILSVILLALAMAFGILFGIAIGKDGKPPIEAPDGATTFRKNPNGIHPKDSENALDNIGHLAYVFDNQSQYHVYAYNSTKSAGQEQVTQSWKDFKSAEKSGEGYSVMVASDLSYSGLVKSATQSCFMGDNKAVIRNGGKPSGTKATPFDIKWETGKPTIYDKEGYKYVYGEFSTEISVYVINEDTLTGASEVKDNGNGTYSQTYYLNETAGCWYQYGMKTRGGLKGYPKFERIDITFTFDSNWQIIESYCEEDAKIRPSQIGGALEFSSKSITTTKYYYKESDVDQKHYAYYNDFFKKYKDAAVSDKVPTVEEPDAMTVLGSGFSEALSDNGQQFKLAITLGETEYEGRVFLKIPDMDDVLGSLDARVALARKDTGNQDLYIEFKNSNLNVYFSGGFAITGDIDGISQSVTKITDWINGINSKPQTASYAVAAEEEVSSGLNLDDLLDAFDLELTDNEAILTLKTDDLLGMGIGVDAVLGFSRVKEADGDLFSIKSVDLNSIVYDGTEIDLKAEIVPDTDGKIIEREQSQTTANLADYIDSIYNILNSNTIAVNISLADKLIEGLTVDVTAYLALGSDIAAYIEISALYKGISLKIDASYVYESTYGKIYLHVSEINGEEVDAKVYCDIGDTISTVKELIAMFGVDLEGSVQLPDVQNELADIINKVVNLNFADIIGKITGDNNKLSLEINVDGLLNGLGVSLGVQFGIVELSVDRANEKVSGSVSALGLNLDITGSEKGLPSIDKNGYVDINIYLNGINSFINAKSYSLELSFVGNNYIKDGLDLTGLELDLNAQLAFADGYGGIRVNISSLNVKYDGLSIGLSAYYEVNFDGSYGKIYLNITSINGKEVSAKVYLDITDAVDGITNIINRFTVSEPDAYAEEESDILGKLIDSVLKLNFNELLKVTNENAELTVDLDTLLEGLELGVNLGAVNLVYSPKDNTLTGSDEAIGLEYLILGASDSELKFSSTGYIDLNEFISAIEELVNSTVYEVAIEFIGGKITDEIDLTGLSVSATAYATVENGYNLITVSIPDMVISYYGVEAELSIYYTVDIATGNYGTAYLEIVRINEVILGAKLYCDIQDTVTAVKDIIAIFKDSSNEEIPAQAKEDGADIISKVVGLLVNLDYGKIISGTQESLNVTLDIDEILSGFDIDLGIALGEVQLSLTQANGKQAQLHGRLEAFGAELTVKGNDSYSMPKINGNDYLDLQSALRLVENIINEGLAIAEAKDIVFSIDAVLSGEIPAEIHGNGEVIWGDSVKFGIFMSIEVDGYKLDINLFYDDTAKDDETLLIITVNEHGTKVSGKEIDQLVDSFNGVIDAFTGGSSAKDDGADEETLVSPDANGYALQVGEKSLEEILKNDNVKKLLGALLDLINDFAIELQTVDAEEAVYNLLIKHSNGMQLTIGTDGCLSVSLSNADKYSANASLEAGNGTTVSSLRDTLIANEGEKYTYHELSQFVKHLYSGFFEDFEEISFKKLFGDNPYLVNINLTGANSGIEALEGVSVNADLYYEEGVVGVEYKTKLVYVDFTLKIEETEVKASVAYSGRTLYLELNKVGSTTLAGIKLKADVDNIFDLVELLVRLITDTNLADMLSSMISGNSTSEIESEQIATFAMLEGENGESAPSLLTQLIEELLTLDIEKAFSFSKEDGVYNAKLNVDSIMGLLLGVEIGTIDITFNSSEKSLSASVGTDGGAWISLSANPYVGDSRKYTLNPDAYLDISFVSTLISDFTSFLTDENGNINKLYTFTEGTISVKIASIISVNFNNAKVTIGLEDGLYFSLTASLEGGLVSNSKICVTYSNGLIVIGRDIDSSPKFRVLTIEYFLDHLFASDSPLQWLLGVTQILWSPVMSIVESQMDLQIGSGLTTPGEYELYEQLAQTVAEEDFNLADYISGLLINAGNTSSSYGNGASLASKQFGLSSNKDGYYAVDLNAEKLTDGQLSELCAVIMRNDESGISGLKAYGSLSVITFTLNLSGFLGGESDAVVPDYLGLVNNYVPEGKEKFDSEKTFTPSDKDKADHKTPIFGQYNSETGAYLTSDVLDTVFVDVYASYESMLAGDNPIRTLEVKYGSTIHLLRGNFPEFADETKTSRLVYVNSNNEPLGSSIIINDSSASIVDGRVSICRSQSLEEAVEVFVHFIDVLTGEEIVSSFSSALKPDEVIADYALNNYVLLGWYSDSAITNQITNINELEAVDGIFHIYGGYLKTSYRAENGVNYSIDEEYFAQNGEIIYYVSGVNDNIISYYSTGKYAGDWLEISAEINGYPVKYIGASAFENVNEDEGNSLVYVLVPASVEAVYSRAFANNKALKQVVFLAGGVFFDGTVDGGNIVNSATTTTVFYGCHPGTSASGNNTNFTVYYYGTRNNPYTHVSSSNTVNSKWNAIYCKSSLGGFGSDTVYYMNVVSSGWMFVEFSSDDSENSFGLSRGLYSESDVSAEKIAQTVIPQLNEMSYLDGFINGYEISLIDTVIDGIHYINIVVSENLSDAMYLLSFDESVCDIDYNEMQGDVVYLNGLYFVRPGASVKFVLKDGLKVITNATVYDNAQLQESDGNLSQSFEASQKVKEVTVTMQSFASYVVIDITDTPTIKTVTIISSEEVKISLDENATEFTTEVTYVVPEGQISYETELSSIRIYAENSEYTLVGLVYENGSALEIEPTITNSVYYAIWIKNREEIEDSVLETVDGSLILSVKSSNTVYGWYSDATFGTPVTVCSNNSAVITSLEHTVLYARYSFNLNFTVSTDNNASFYYFTPDNWTGESTPTESNCNDMYLNASSTKSFSRSFEVLEDTAITVELTDSDKCLKIGVGGNVYYIRVKGGDGNFSTFDSLSVNGGGAASFVMTANASVTVHNNAADSDSGCVAMGTLITLADGSQVAVEDLTGNEMLLVWNLYTGTYDVAPILFVDSEPMQYYEVINLTFSDGTAVKVISEHGFWDYDLNEYVYLDKYSAKYLGHWFNKGDERVQLVNVEINQEYTSPWSPVTYGHLCYFVNGMLSMPGGISGLFNIFEVDSATMKYDESLMQADIELYGLFTYEEFIEYFYLPEEAFEAFNGQYLKVAIGKGLITMEKLVALYTRYADFLA